MQFVQRLPTDASARWIVAALERLLEPILVMYRFRRILYATSVAEIRGKHIGTMFGLAWAVLYPFLFLGLYATVYAFVLRVRLSNFGPFDYVLLVFSGLVPFIGFSEALGTSVIAVVANKNLLKNTMFPIELLPVRAVITGSVSMLVGLVGLLIATWANRHVFLSQLLIVPILLLQFLFSVGVGWIVAALNVFVRDLGQAIGVIVLFLMIASPIGYTVDMIPERLLLVSHLNPLYYLIELYRESLLFGAVSVRLLAIFTAIALLTLLAGHFLFARLKPIFAEYV
jgi:lipopolysaccharide transport system permease protein